MPSPGTEYVVEPNTSFSDINHNLSCVVVTLVLWFPIDVRLLTVLMTARKSLGIWLSRPGIVLVRIRQLFQPPLFVFELFI